MWKTGGIRLAANILLGLSAGILLGLAAGCSTSPASHDHAARFGLRSLPTVPGGLQADRALVTAFFDAHGLDLSLDQIDRIVPAGARPGHFDRQALRKAASQHGYQLVVLKADPRYLRYQLAAGLVLMVLLPSDRPCDPSATPLIPVAWDQANQCIEVLDGNGTVQSLSEDDFFSPRAPLKHAALCLIKSKGLHRFEPPREQQLVLSDFWHPQGYNPPGPAPVPEPPVFRSDDLDSMMTCGQALFRQRRYTDAIGVFHAALRIAPDNPDVLNHLAHAILMGNGGLMTALRHANKAHQLAPHDPLVLENLGSINLQLGDSQAAVRYLEQAWARALRRSPGLQVTIMDQLVRAWLAADRLDLAREVAQHRCRTFPEFPLPFDIRVQIPGLRRARLFSGSGASPQRLAAAD